MKPNQSLLELTIKRSEFPKRGICCYCEQSCTIKEYMTQIPKDSSEIFQKWVDILGGTFLKNVNSKLSKCYICKSHFKETWSSKCRPLNLLPFADLGRPDIVVEDEDEINEDQVDKAFHKCAYCGNIDKFCKMTVVPTNEYYFNKWVRILGEEFKKNVENCERIISAICRTHFDREFRNRPQTLLPISMENPEKHAEIEEKKEKVEPNILQCCYCSEVGNNLNEMVQTPKDTKGLLRWADILGPIFYENYMKRKKRFICLEHLKKGSKRIFNDEIMKDFRQRQILKEKEKSFIPNIPKEEEIEIEEKPEIEKILIEKDFKMEEEEVKPPKLKNIKLEIQD